MPARGSRPCVDGPGPQPSEAERGADVHVMAAVQPDGTASADANGAGAGAGCTCQGWRGRTDTIVQTACLIHASERLTQVATTTGQNQVRQGGPPRAVGSPPWLV